MSEKLNGSLSIVQVANGKISIELTDSASHCTFVRVEVDRNDFVDAMFGLAQRQVKFETRCLEHIGMKKEIESVELTLTAREIKSAKLDRFDKTKIEAWLIQNKQRKGWNLNSSLSSQRSIEPTDKNGLTIRFSYFRYTKIKQENKNEQSVAKQKEGQPLRSVGESDKLHKRAGRTGDGSVRKSKRGSVR